MTFNTGSENLQTIVYQHIKAIFNKFDPIGKIDSGSILPGADKKFNLKSGIFAENLFE